MRGVLDLKLDERRRRGGASRRTVARTSGRASRRACRCGAPERAAARVGLDGDDGFVDESAGYHARHTAWRWSAGIGRLRTGARWRGTWSTGCTTRRRQRAHRLGRRRAPRGGRAAEFAEDLRWVGGLGFTRMVRARGATEPAADAQELPPAFRRRSAASCRAVCASQRATGSWNSTMCAGEGVPCVARRAARRGTRAGCGAGPPCG